MTAPDSAGVTDPADGFAVVLQSGEYAFREGDRALAIYVIEEGRIELTSSTGTKRAVLEAGDFFGERALTDEAPREMSAQALTRARLLRLDKATFASLVRESPDIAMAMLGRLSRAVGTREQAPAHALLVHEASGVELALSAASHSVGRSSQTRGVQPDIDLTRFDPEKTLSRKHARIDRRPDGFYIVEEEGRNGTFVNGRRLAGGQEMSLADGDRVTFGLVEVVFRMC
jgi:hypothetical protein